MRKNLRTILTLLLAATVSFAAFGSGQGESDEGSGDAITVSHYFVEADDSAQARAGRHMMEVFQEENPDVNLEIDTIGHDSYEERILVLAAGNELPDVFRFRASSLDDFIEGGLIHPLQDVMEETTPEFVANRLPNSFGQYNTQGDIWGVPMNALSTSLVYYNKDIFDEVGIDSFPETWAEFEDAIVEIRDAGYIPIAMGNQAPWLGQSCYLSTIGTRYTGEEWFYDILEGEGAAFTDEPFVESLAAMQNLAEMGAFNDDFLSIDNTAMRRLFYNKRAAMFIEGSWALEQVEASAPDDVREATRIEILPSIEGTNVAQDTMSGGPSAWAWGINGNLSGERLENAWKLLAAINGVESANIMAESGAIPLSRTTDYDQSGLTDRQVRFLEIFDEYTITPIYDAYLGSSLIETINNGIQELLLGRVSPEGLAQRIQDEYTRQ